MSTTTMQEKKTGFVSDIEKSKSEQVKDNYKIVHVLFIFVGIVHFLPATFFTTANDYWMYKFRNTSLEETDADHRTVLQTRFSPSVTISTTISTILFSTVTLVFGHRINYKMRLYGSLVGIVVLYVIGAIFILVDTDSWQLPFFAITMVTIIFINGLGSTFGLAFFTTLAKFPNEYLESYLNGQGIAGILTALLQVMSLAVGVSTSKSAMVYFWIAIALILFCVVCFMFVDRHNSFFQYHNSKEAKVVEKQERSFGEFMEMLRTLWKSQAVLTFYLLTLGPIHPAITSLVVSEGAGNGDWNDVYFVPVCTFVLYSVGELTGRLIPVKFRFLQKVNGIWYVAFSVVRVGIYVPLIMLCNAHPRSHLAVVFPHDYQYVLILATLAVGSGFLLSVGNLLVPQSVPEDQLEYAFHVNLVCATVQLGASSFLGFVSVDLL